MFYDVKAVDSGHVALQGRKLSDGSEVFSVILVNTDKVSTQIDCVSETAAMKLFEAIGCSDSVTSII